MLVEFRHKSWFEQPTETLSFLEQHGMTYVTVDAPATVIPLVLARTTATAYVRFHGRNRETWFKRTGSAAERFDYLYSGTELAEWARSLHELAANGAENVYAMFNNNGRSQSIQAPRTLLGESPPEEIAQAPTNAATLLDLLSG
jgi:uncharacterized protein YecE (DUF72 family)